MLGDETWYDSGIQGALSMKAKHLDPGHQYVVVDFKKERYVLVVDPNLMKKGDFEWVEEAGATKFPDSASAFEAWKMLRKIKIPNLRVAPTGWRH